KIPPLMPIGACARGQTVIYPSLFQKKRSCKPSMKCWPNAIAAEGRDTSILLPGHRTNQQNEGHHTGNICQCNNKILVENGGEVLFHSHQIVGSEKEKRDTHENAKACWLAHIGSEVDEKDEQADDETCEIEHCLCHDIHLWKGR